MEEGSSHLKEHGEKVGGGKIGWLEVFLFREEPCEPFGEGMVKGAVVFAFLILGVSSFDFIDEWFAHFVEKSQEGEIPVEVEVSGR